MHAKYAKSKRADNDIKHIIISSMADFGEVQTDTYMQGFESALCELANMPNKGRVFVSDKTGREYLRYRYVSHVIYYRKRQDDVFIARILHVKMLPENHL
jgi:toxin ParE1/3/4